MAATTWRAEIGRRMAAVGEDWADVVATRPDGALDLPFENGRHRPPPPEFRLWTRRHVYYPLQIDGYPRVGSSPRDP